MLQNGASIFDKCLQCKQLAKTPASFRGLVFSRNYLLFLRFAAIFARLKLTN